MDSWVTSNASAANDRATRFYYDGSGELRYTIDGEGFAAQVDVDAEGRVTKTTRWSNAITVGDSTTIDNVTSLLAAGGGIKVETLTAYDALGRVDTVTDAEGSITRFTYGANGLTSDQTIAWGTNDAATAHYVYDGAGRVIETHGAYGSPEVAIVRQSYDGLGNVLTVTDANNKVTSFTYDHLGQVLTQTDALSGVVTYQYDGFGQAVKVTDKLGRSSFSYYDKLGRLISVRDAEDYVTETSYTAFSQVLNVTRRYNKATGTAVVGTLPTVTADAKDAVTSFEYDKRGLTTKATDAEGYYEQYTLNAFGDRTSVLGKLGGSITNAYDRRGLLTSEILPMAAMRADGTTQASTVTNKFEYDARGNRTRMIEAFGLTEQRTTNYVYDKVNRLTSKTLDAVSTVSYSDFTSTTAVTVTTSTGVIPTESYVYDAAGRLKQVTDAYGGRTVSFYDDLGRKTDEVGPLGTMTHWTYDANGNMLTARVYGDAVTVPLATATAPPAPINASNYRETVYTYDNLSRLKTTSIASVLVGTWNGTSGVAPTTVTITSSIDYDANGNVIRTTDANGNAAYSYYDKLGRKTVQADQENYLTSWSYDAEGNVLGETRFATKYVGTPSLGGTPPTVAADATNDRTTSFTYDRNGNRLTESRASVKIATVNTTNGAITETTVASTITYTYNGLGQVLTKQEAAGDTVAYTYDATGRLTKESRASYGDQTLTTVTPTVDYLYNGLNNLARTRQGGATAVAGDRITTYAYGAGGRLASVTDPAGGTHSYDYDAAGNIVRDSYTRVKSDGTTQLNEGILYRRDLLGRVVGQAIATKVSATSWTRGDGQNTAYNVYGDVSQRGINGLWQETFSYNNRGLLEKTNSGDGVWRFFVYDANGNKTLTIEDENYTAQDLSTKTISQVLGYLGATAGATFVDGLNASIATYDKRGQALSSILTQRELSATGGKVSITASQTYNAFGETASQTDARGYTTDLTYNTMGRLIQKQLPAVNWTSVGGTVTSARPTLLYYYDASGRLVASKDANNNLTSRTLLAGSGFGEAEALVTAEYHVDGGIARTMYDVFGDARILRNELNVDETHVYDTMGRLITQTHRGGLVDNFTYDLLGQRITHWNSFYGSGTKETTDYDLQGRVVSTKDFAADLTTNSYTWSASIATALGTTGGWTQTTTSLGKTKSETSDIFGNVTTETDTGAHTETNTYDKAGRLTNVSGSNGTYTTTLVHSYFNTGLVSQTVDTAGTGLNTITGTFAYDANGNRTAEKYSGTVYKSVSDASWNSYVSSAQTLQDATVTYDALGRLTDLTSTSSTGTTTLHQEYDLNSNIRRTQATSPNLVAGGSLSTDKWFDYDAMNRMVAANGFSSGTAIMISADTDGTYMSYDLAGNRKTETRRVSEYEAEIHHTYYFNYSEQFTYDNDGNLTSTYDEETGYTATTTRNLAGRVTAYTEKDSLNNFLQNRYSITYNARGQVTYDETSQKKGTDTFLNKVTNTYDAVTGMLTSTVSDNYKNGSDSGALDTSLTNSYAWYDTGKTLHTDYDRDTGSSSNSIYTSDYIYDGLGRLQRTKINDGINRTVHFAMTADEQILLRDVNNSGPNDPEDHHVFVSGRQVAEYTSDDKKNIDNINYKQSIDDHMSTASGSSKFYHGGASVAGAEVGTSTFTPLNPITAGTGQNASRYVVQSGDTLQGIAASLWGDSSLWYKLAESNGLGANSALVEGQTLSVPVGVVKSSNNAATFNPYDTARATGDLSPTTNKPPKKNKCGMFGQLLIVVVAVAVTAITAGAAAAALGPASGILSGLGALASGSMGALGVAIGAGAAAIGSAVSQGVGIAAGIQDSFSWKAVALAGIAGGVTAGVNASGVFSSITSTALRAGVSAAASSAISQGIGVVTGLQKKFDWAGVAAAGVAAGVSAGIGKAIGAKPYIDSRSIANFGVNTVADMAGSIANAATRSVINGSDFGDNLLAGLPDVIGNTIGNILVYGGRHAASQQPAPRAAAPLSGTAVEAPGSTGQTAEPTPESTGDEQEIVVTGTRTKTRMRGFAAAYHTYLYGQKASSAASVSRPLAAVIYADGPRAGEKIVPVDPAVWVDPYHMKGDDGLDYFGRYGINLETGEQHWQDFVSEDAWNRAQIDYALEAGGEALVGIGSDVVGGLYDVGRSLVGAGIATGKFVIDANLAPYDANANARTGARIDAIGATLSDLWDNPDKVLAIVAEPYRQMFEEGRIRGYTSMVAGEALGAFVGPTASYSPTIRSFDFAVEGGMPSHLAAGVADEAAWMAEMGFDNSSKALWRPSAAEIDSQLFQDIVGTAKYTPGGKPVGTIFDAIDGGFFERKSGSSTLNSSYQLRLQTYRSVSTGTDFTLSTARPINPTFNQWLNRWGVNVTK
ncbi:LysM peptidoglycan-binding domain-containing protein [Sphingomonas sp.]|uniref:LysM peptidoglycan-binding domain-containing protein n=1 Tax=Sphingomonas sp. TaxID=28214 RepID=UPI0025D9CE5A|nr:LysM peptidoglycan-binding domain-containing protein [Sphingomonas sp.]